MTLAAEVSLEADRLFDPAAPLTASGTLRRRMIVSSGISAAASLAAALAIGVLGVVVLSVVTRGGSALGTSFVFANPSGLAGGGIANSLLGTAEIVAIAAAIALPIGILTGIYLTEFAKPASAVARILKLALDLMQGLPTIVVGLFVYSLIVIPARRESGLAGAVALAVVMLPLIARASQEVLALVPGSLREAADALGVTRWRSITGVVLPVAASGIVTGAVLAVARAAGETAPLLVCDSIFAPDSTQLNPLHGVPSIPMLILNTSDLAIPGAFARAWGAAFILLMFILLANLAARLTLARSRRRSGL